MAGGAAGVFGQALLFGGAEEADFEAVDCEGAGLVTACSVRGIRAGKLHAGAQGRQGL